MSRPKNAPKIALDFDNVLADTISSWIDFYNKRYSAILRKVDIKAWAFWDDLRITKKEADDLFQLTWSDWRHLRPTEEDIAGKVNQLEQDAIVDIVTSASPSHLKYIKSWLEDKVLKSYNFLYASEKASLNYDLFIDDSPIVANECAKMNKLCLLYDQPWNRDISGRTIIRVKSLEEANDVIHNMV